MAHLSLLATNLNRIASSLESKGLLKEALELDKAADMIEAAAATPAPNTKLVEIKKILGIPENNKKLDRSIGILIDEASHELIDKSFHIKENINGIQFNIGWSPDEKMYTIYMPQVHVYDQIIPITNKIDDAKKIHRYMRNVIDLNKNYDAEKLKDTVSGYIEHFIR